MRSFTIASLNRLLEKSVLKAISYADKAQENLSGSRLDIVNNYHARMLSSAVLAAQSEQLEYVQMVSFGCGHDAYLSDEIIRMMSATMSAQEIKAVPLEVGREKAIQILPLDYDPDVSFANIENRLQMLITNISRE